jgi:TetR/AcrR family transcriptional regulator, fatty acid metabolism regulator protein
MNDNLSRRQEEIINAAIKLIGEGGIQALTIKNLSAEIGIAESALYRHFKSKTEVLNALLDFLNSFIISNYENVHKLKITSFRKIEKMITGQLKLFYDNPPYAIVVLSDGLYKNNKSLYSKIFSVMERTKSTFINIIEEGQNNGEIRKDVPSDQLAFLIMGSIRLTVTQWSLSGFKFDLKKRGNILVKTFATLIQSSQYFSEANN